MPPTDLTRDHAHPDKGPAEILAAMQAELRRIAASQLARERPDHTLQPTALVNEAYLRLVAQRNLQGVTRAQFMAAATETMRRVLVDHARKRQAAIRGGGRKRVTISDVEPTHHDPDLDVLALNDALDRLKAQSERACQVVSMRFFAGMTVDEVAEALNISPRTVADDWTFAKAWLKQAMAG